VKLSHERVGRVVPEDGGVGSATSRRGGGSGPNIGRRGEEVLRLGDLAGQSIGRIALPLPHECSGAHTGLPLRGSSPGSGESGGESGVGTVDGSGVRRWSGKEEGRALRSDPRTPMLRTSRRGESSSKGGSIPGAQGKKRSHWSDGGRGDWSSSCSSGT
jgi:hypothetical protein